MSLWIDGEWIDGQGETLEKYNPVTGEPLWRGLAASAEQVQQACIAARHAFPGWEREPLSARQAIVERFAALLESHKSELTDIIARETANPRWEAAT